ncbi:MAG: hypothetical protein IPH78_14505 [Bacteroidetes bacterium]|nr:hypothetical protein [Bacteroidota bacterium]
MKHLVYTPFIQSLSRDLIIRFIVFFAGIAFNSQVMAQCGTTYTVTITTCGFWDESHFEIRNASGGVVYSQAAAGTFTYTASGVAPNHGPFTFFIETQGTYNDNCANWSVSACGMATISGTITGGLTYTSGGFCGGPVGSPYVAGNNQWYVSCFEGSNFNTYRGYYMEPDLNFNSANRWSTAGSPSDAPGYQGCPIGADYHSTEYRRQGFPCGYYSLNIPTHDDDISVWVDTDGNGTWDGLNAWTHVGCCDAHNNIWTGLLNANSIIAIQTKEGVGGSQVAMNIVPTFAATAGINTWNVHGFTHTGYNFANLSTFSGHSHVGYYTNSVLDITSTNQWCSTCSPSDAVGWYGCVLGADNHTVVYKRQGFPCKVYQIDLNGHDDGVMCFVNGVQVYSLDGCCADRGVIWTGVLGPNSTVEFRVMEGGGGSNLTVDFIEIGDLAITSSSAALYSCESPRTLTANYGGGTWSGPGVSGNTFNPSGSVGNQTITYTLEGCAVNQTINVLSQPGNASVFGSNQWNIYGYNSTDLVTNYYGFYTDTRLNVNTQDRWDLGTQSPSNATTGPNGNGWTGCTVPPDNHSYRIRRQGFPCGLYNIQVMNDDNYNVLLNGASIHAGGCCTNPTGVLSNRFLGTNTTLELTIVEGGGGSYGGFILTKTADLAITSSNAAMYNCDAARALTANAAGGVWSGPGVSGSSFNPSGLSGNQTITYTLDGCSVTQTINVLGNGNPATFGANTWNVYGYNGNDVNLGGGLAYRGYYTEPLLSYSSSNRWTNAPSDASGWVGCAVNVDNHTVVSKRTGVPANGVYSVSVNQHDDNYQFHVGGVNQFESPYCCILHTDMHTQYMDGNTNLEMRHVDGSGPSSQGLTFTLQNLNATVTKTDKTLCNVNNGTMLLFLLRLAQ